MDRPARKRRVNIFQKYAIFCLPLDYHFSSITNVHQPHRTTVTMNARTDISVLAHENRDYSAIRESSARAHAAILSPVMTTVSVVREIGDFEEVIAAARASVAHSLAIAKARRFFSDRDASQAVSEAEQFDLLVEKQIAAIQNLAEVRNLLTDLASEPARQSAHRGENVPGWTLLLASRAGALLRAIWQ